jgi:exonuclease SbcC
VELEFEINNDIYTIKRFPTQERPKRNSQTEFTTKPHRVEMSQKGKTNVLTKVSDVENKVNEILGISYEQFSQIVMLPQGEFQKLLLSKSDEKTSVFRKIFKTYFYKDVQEELFEHAKKLKEKLQSKVSDFDSYANQIRLDQTSQLYSLIDTEYKNFDLIMRHFKDYNKSLRKQFQEQKQIVNKIQKKTDSLKEEIKEQDRINQDFSRLEILKEDWDKHSQKSHEMNQLDNEIKLLQEVKEIQPHEERYSNTNKECHDISKDINAKESTLKQLKVDFQQVEMDYKLIPNREKEIEELSIKQIGLKNTIEDFKQWNTLKERYKSLDESLSMLNQEKSDLEQRLVEVESSIVDKKTLISNLDHRNNEHKDLDERIATLNHNKINIERLMNQHQQLEKRNQSIHVMQEDFKNLSTSFKQKELDFRQITEDYLTGQASLLAKEIKEGEPCPVCGSTNHPLLAKSIHSIDHSVFQEEQDKYDTAKAEYQTLLTTLQQEQSHYNESLEDLKTQALTYKIDDLTKIEITYKKVVEDWEKLNQLKLELESIQEKVKNEKQKLDTLLSSKEKLLGNQTANIEKLATKKTSLNEVKEQIDLISLKVKDYSSQEDLTLEIKQIEGKTLSLKNQNENIRNKYQYLTNDINKYQALIQQLKESLVIKENQMRKAKETYISKLVDLNKNEEWYHSKKIDLTNLKDYQDKVDSYKERGIRIQQSIHDLKGLLNGKKIVDLDPMNSSLTETQSQLQKEIEILNQYDVDYSINSDLYEKMNRIFTSFAATAKAAETAESLANIARGKIGNKISFERYVLAYYFNQIIGVANLKLSKMTNDRYHLYRKDEKSKGAQQQGLDLVVYDSYTSRYRDVSTLSGGESFKAALALALGLAEIIQQNAGGISLETMFIDEGFGTLDPQSLDMAIEVLLNINQSGRVVGVISHVQELKDRIETKIELEITNQGSTITLQT